MEEQLLIHQLLQLLINQLHLMIDHLLIDLKFFVHLLDLIQILHLIVIYFHHLETFLISAKSFPEIIS